ncbi:MAG: nitrate reductase [Gammaproteobacteria bacterium]|nr:nitrate reductase [Gammaproteobacteria bacterium]MBT8111189.1 nitrate reductase [Gammaproteobacteria bacterium]NND46366.1 nitrate reductase [Woeseiaceae bacterium]NNL45887.1 nitrate reductase [Woeseiaceae bacterium]
MDLLELARGPVLQAAAYILVGGTIWRLLGIILLAKKPDYSEARGPGGLGAAAKVIWSRAYTAEPFKRATLYPKIMGYVLHVGLFATVLLFVPHIVFFEGFLGFGWPGLPNSIIFFIGVATVISGVALLVRRLTSPVLKLISNFDDYFSWFVTMLPLVTGLLIPIRLGIRYETLLAVHILSVALLLIWLPFGKLGHTFLVFLTRGTTGMVFERRGAKT